MAGHVSLLPDVWGDIDAIARSLLDDDPVIAERCTDAVFDSVKFLGQFPGVGSPKTFRKRRLARMRSWSVSGFPNHLIIYRLTAVGDVEVVAIEHGARHLPRFLDQRLGP